MLLLFARFLVFPSPLVVDLTSFPLLLFPLPSSFIPPLSLQRGNIGYAYPSIGKSLYKRIREVIAGKELRVAPIGGFVMSMGNARFKHAHAASANANAACCSSRELRIIWLHVLSSSMKLLRSTTLFSEMLVCVASLRFS
jgi:hypothetical protein